MIISHLLTTSRSLLKFSTEQFKLVMLVLSKNKKKSLKIQFFERSFMYIKNKIKHKIEPGGTPYFILKPR